MLCVHVDSLRQKNSKNSTSAIIASITFENDNVTFTSYFHSRVQFDDAFDIAYGLLERKSEISSNPSVPTSGSWNSEDHITLFSTAHFLIDVLTKDPAQIEFYTENLPKGIR